MKLKVLFLPAWYPSEEKRIEGIFVKEHVKAAQLYDEVAVLFGKPFRGWPWMHSAIEDGLPTFRFFFPNIRIPETCWLSYTMTMLRAFKKVEKVWGTPDVIHAQEPIAAFGAMVLSLLYGLPYVVSEHCSYFPLRKIGLGQIIMARLAFRRAQRVLGVNPNFVNDFRHYGIRCDFHWLPNSVDTDIFFPPRSKLRKPIIVHCSRFHEIKRVPDLIKAFALCQKEFPYIRLELIGEGVGRKDMEKLATELLQPHSFRFYGLQPKSFLAQRLREACVFVLPSAYETQSCVLLEAMACGTPVVATNVGGIPHIVTTETGILVEPGNIEALAGAIRSILAGVKKFNQSVITDYAIRHFSKQVVGKILHKEHLRATQIGKKPESNRLIH
jgi:glycosyltransferase involved in cell wall biosynthesis|uniref:Glycosyltransferase family 4 protein n=1 Tax=Desulfobacca acetoxidans TaxID=60893 RepID=A0A7C3SK37_9BACT